MYDVIVIGKWGTRIDNRDGVSILFSPQIANDFGMNEPDSTTISYATIAQNGGQVLPEPNMNMWRIVCDPATYNAIDADPNYIVHSSEDIGGDEEGKPPNGMPDAAEYGLMRAYYAQLKNANNTPALTPQEITDILGPPNEYSRGQIIKRNENGVDKGAIPWCASLKKAV
jgi:hypothetical protein